MSGKATLECSVCCEKYNLGNRMPTGLRCFHTFCKECVSKITTNDKAFCPTCRKETDDKDVNTNYSLADILESLCEQCTAQDKDCTCHHCGKVLCTSCIKEHTKEYQEQVRAELADLGQSVKAAADMSMDQAVIEGERARRQKAIDEINKAICLHRQAIKDLEKSLNDEVAKLYDSNVNDHLDWQKKIREMSTEFGDFVQKTKSNISISSERITTESLRSIQDKCEKLKFNIKAEMENSPALTNYTFLAPENHQKINVGKLILMTGSRGKGLYQFDTPWDVTCIQDRIYMSDKNNRRIKVYNYDLRLLSTFGLKGNDQDQFSYPAGVAARPCGELYITDWFIDRIKVCGEDGSTIRTIGRRGAGDGELSAPAGLAVSDDDMVFVCDSWNYRVQVLKTDGTYLDSIGSKGSNPGEFSTYPNDIAVTKDNKVLVTQEDVKTISVFSVKGEFLETWPKKLPDAFPGTEAHGVCVDQNDNIIVSYNSGCLAVLKKDGVFMYSVGTEGDQPGEMDDPRGVCARADGRVVVCDTGNDRIQVLSI